MCRETVDELIRVLAYPKFRLADAERNALLEGYLPFAESVRLPDPPPAVPAISRDRSDLAFIQLATVAKADLLVSGDADLLVLRDVITVASAAELRLRIGASD